jgi:O-succinylbenzoic acid--CoA ligase
VESGATTWLVPLRETATKIDALAQAACAKIVLREVPSLAGTPIAYRDGESFLSALRHSGARTLLNTSGSTGWPKFVEHRLLQHIESAKGVNEVMAYDATQRWLLSLPLFHVGGLAIVVRAFCAGASIALPATAESVEDVILRMPVTHVSLVATQLKRLISNTQATTRLSQCRRIMLGGGPVPTWLSEVAMTHALPLIASYGATEMASTWTATGLLEGEISKQGSGRLLPSRELRLSSDGEVCVRGAMLFESYVGKSRESCFDSDGFYRSSDIGRVDDQGNLHILGRKDNMFISGGENIHPQEIEMAILNHPLVEEAIVVSVPNEKWGERPVAFVRMSEDNLLCDGDLKEHLKKTLPAFKIPDRFLEWPREFLGQLKPSRANIRRKAELLI